MTQATTQPTTQPTTQAMNTKFNEPSGTDVLPPAVLQQIIERLTAILETENAALDARQPAKLNETAAEKDELVSRYNRQMARLKSDPTLYAIYDRAEIDALKQASQTFHAALDSHFRKLSTVKSVTEGMMKAISDEVTESNRPGPAYTNRAALRQGGLGGFHRAPSPRASIAINEVV